MSVVVLYKYTPNPQDATVQPDGTVDWSRAKPAVSENDPVAIECARKLATALDTELVGVTVGPAYVGSAMARKNAMSRGCDRGVICADDVVLHWNGTQVAAAAAHIVNSLGDVTAVVAGDSSVDNAAGMMPATVAGFLGWPAFLEISDIAVEAGHFVMTQQASQSVRTLEVAGPLVCAVTSDAAQPFMPSMKDILAAGKKPVDVVQASDCPVPDVSAHITGHARPERRTRKHQLYATPEDLAQALYEEGVIA